MASLYRTDRKLNPPRGLVAVAVAGGVPRLGAVRVVRVPGVAGWRPGANPAMRPTSRFRSAAGLGQKFTVISG
jgi:hypothetical protein